MKPTSPARYHRQVILPGVGPGGQARLQRARVLVIGMGGLGSPSSLYLAAAGVGTMGIADADVVEESNLHRQILHDTNGLRTNKVDSAHLRLSALNPDIDLVRHASGMTPENAVELIEGYDLIVDGTDNFPTRYLINDAAFLTGKPVIYGSIFQFEGQVTVFDRHGGSPCYRCLFPDLPEPGTVPNCAEAGVFGALCGIVGSWQANEALKVILGIGDPLTGRLKVIDTLRGRDSLVRIKRDPGCPLCGEQPSITQIRKEAYSAACDGPAAKAAERAMEICVKEAAKLLDATAPPELLDVREAYERRICRIGEGLHIPIGELPARASSLPRDRDLLVYCHHGVRSLSAVRFLREKGFPRARSIRGGTDTWSREIDPALPRY